MRHTCIICQVDAPKTEHWSRICKSCRDKQANLGLITTPQKACATIINTATRSGILPKLHGEEIRCVDCGKPARHYDHRDYMKPLDVDPVCSGCNRRRGAGLNNDPGYMREKLGFVSRNFLTS